MVRKCGVCGEEYGRMNYGGETEVIHCRCTRRVQAGMVVVLIIALLAAAVLCALLPLTVSTDAETGKKLYRESKYRAYRDLRTEEERVLWMVTGEMKGEGK